MLPLPTRRLDSPAPIGDGERPRRCAGPAAARMAMPADFQARPAPRRHLLPAAAAWRLAPGKPGARVRRPGGWCRGPADADPQPGSRPGSGPPVSKSMSPKSSSALSACQSRDPVMSRKGWEAASVAGCSSNSYGDRSISEAGQQPQHPPGFGQRPGIEQVQGQLPGSANQPAGLLGRQLRRQVQGRRPPGHRPGGHPGTAGRCGCTPVSANAAGIAADSAR